MFRERVSTTQPILICAVVKVDAFFRVSVSPDYSEPGQNTVTISPAGLGLPDKTFYQRFPNDSSIQAIIPDWLSADCTTQRIKTD